MLLVNIDMNRVKVQYEKFNLKKVTLKNVKFNMNF